MASVVTVKGAKQVISKFRKISQVAARDLGFAVFASAQSIEKKAKRTVHSSHNPWPGREKNRPQSDHLYNGIEAVKLGVYNWVVTASSIRGGADKEYAHFEEEGTSKAPAHPYMRPSVPAGFLSAMNSLRAIKVRIESL